jgi:branched-chain amino acid transport system permease protein
MKEIVAVVVNSLLAAGLYATMSYGLAVIYGVMRIINLAHAGILMLGAYATFTLHSRFGIDPFLSLVVVVPVFFGFGMLLYVGLVGGFPDPPRGRRSESLLLLFGLWLVLQNLAYAIWSGDTSPS